jgi:DNA invertase Pin-like site-specific DNA recombinase
VIILTDLIAYLRVSTGRQEISGLGLEAQREATEQYARLVRGTIIGEFVETQSGAKNDRPQLAAALAQCRRQKATLLIARLDRLSRSLSFVAQLLDANVEIKCADMPEANRLLLQMLAVFSEHERQMIRERTRAALAAAKARGVILGANGKIIAAANRDEANRFAELARHHVNQAKAVGNVTLRSIGDYLGQAGVKSPGGVEWHPTSVKRLLRRLETIDAVQPHPS